MNPCGNVIFPYHQETCFLDEYWENKMRTLEWAKLIPIKFFCLADSKYNFFWHPSLPAAYARLVLRASLSNLLFMWPTGCLIWRAESVGGQHRLHSSSSCYWVNEFGRFFVSLNSYHGSSSSRRQEIFKCSVCANPMVNPLDPLLFSGSLLDFGYHVYFQLWLQCFLG